MGKLQTWVVQWPTADCLDPSSDTDAVCLVYAHAVGSLATLSNAILQSVNHLQMIPWCSWEWISACCKARLSIFACQSEGFQGSVQTLNCDVRRAGRVSLFNMQTVFTFNAANGILRKLLPAMAYYDANVLDLSNVELLDDTAALAVEDLIEHSHNVSK